MKIFDLLNQQPVNFLYLALDKFLDINLPTLKNFYSISPEKLKIKLKLKNSGNLLNHPETVNYINSIASQTKNKTAIIPFKPSAKIQNICQKHNWIYIANDSSLNRLLEDKIKFSEICKRNNIPTIINFTKPFNQTNFTEAQSLFGNKIVCQTHFGWAGNSTHLFSNWDSAQKIIKSNTPTKFSPLLEGYTLLNNCCLTRSVLIQSPPALQFTGIKQLTNNPFITVGRQWPANISPTINQQIHEITTKFSNYLKKINYLGFFGLDFFVNNNQVYLLECNPRLTASFSFYTQIEINNQLNPLFLFHIAEFLNIKYPDNFNFNIDRFYNDKIIGSELVLKNDSGVTTKRLQKFAEFSPTPQPVFIPDQILKELLS